MTTTTLTTPFSPIVFKLAIHVFSSIFTITDCGRKGNKEWQECSLLSPLSLPPLARHSSKQSSHKAFFNCKQSILSSRDVRFWNLPNSPPKPIDPLSSFQYHLLRTPKTSSPLTRRTCHLFCEMTYKKRRHCPLWANSQCVISHICWWYGGS